MVLWIRLSLREPERWQHARDVAEATTPEIDGTAAKAPAKSGFGSLSELLGDPRWRTRALVGLGLAAVGLSTYWGIFAWGPELVDEVLGQSVSPEVRKAKRSLAYLLMSFTGGLFGLLSFAPLASWKGRRFA